MTFPISDDVFHLNPDVRDVNMIEVGKIVIDRLRFEKDFMNFEDKHTNKYLPFFT